MVAHDPGEAGATRGTLCRVEQLRRGRVDQPHIALGIGDDDAVGQVLQDRLQPATLARQPRHLVLQLLSHAVEGDGQPADLVTRGRVGARAEIPAGHAVGDGRQLFHRASDAAGDEQRQQQHGDRCRYGDSDQRLAQAGDAAFDLIQRQRNPRNPGHLPARVDRHRPVHHLLAQCGAETCGRSRTAGQSLPHLRPIQVVFHGVAVAMRLAEHHAIRRDDRHSPVDQFSPAARQRVQTLLTRLPARIAPIGRGRVADQPRLGQQRDPQVGQMLFACPAGDQQRQPQQHREGQNDVRNGDAPADGAKHHPSNR